MKHALDKKHLENLKELDRILQMIYKEGENRADFSDVFTPEGATDDLAFLFTPERQKEAIRFLEEEGLIVNSTGTGYSTYRLTFKGILRAWGNTFEKEYTDKVKEQVVSKRFQMYFLILAALSLFSSILSIIRCA